METQPKILLIDDEYPIAETVIAYAKKDNMLVTHISDWEKWLDSFFKNNYDLVLLDWMLPWISGPEILKKIREKSKVPVIMLTARDDESDIVIWFELLADDYITKPFWPRELMARIKNSLRRNSSLNKWNWNVQIFDLEISFDKMEIHKWWELVKLTPNEFRVLYELYNNAWNVVSREVLMEKALWYRNYLNDRTIDTHIKNIRQKLEKDSRDPKIIKTIRELWFRLDL